MLAIDEPLLRTWPAVAPMAAFVVVLLGLLGFTIGFAVTGEPAGGVATTVGALVLGSLAGIGTRDAAQLAFLARAVARRQALRLDLRGDRIQPVRGL